MKESTAIWNTMRWCTTGAVFSVARRVARASSSASSKLSARHRRVTQKLLFMKNSLKQLKFEELKSLDLGKCETVGDIVDGMRYCAFGARMLGEVAHTIREMVTAKDKPILIYSGIPDTPLGLLLKKFVANEWCRQIVLPSEYAQVKQ